MSLLTEETETVTVLEFIQKTIRENDNVKVILNSIPYIEGKVTEIVESTKEEVTEDRSSQGFYYERLWDLCIKFGATNLTLPAIKGILQTSHIINENPNKEGIDFKLNCWDNNVLNKNPGGYLLNKVRSGNSGGYSDITFLNKRYDEQGNKYEELIFISVKYFKEEKQISEYDIGKLCSLIREHEKENRDIKLYIFVNNKRAAIEKFNAQHTSSNILIKYINPHGNHEHIYDLNDLQDAFFKLKKILESYNYLQTPDNIGDFQKNYLNVSKDVFIPRFHQKLFISKINKLIEDGENNVLVGAIPRSGKSYIMAGTILEYIKSQEDLDPSKRVKILMMTPAPNETFGEYELIFNKYNDFDKLDVVIHKDGVNSKKIFKSDKHSVVIISKQKLGSSSEEEKDKEEEEDMLVKRIIKLFGSNPDIDMMFLDEAHFGMSTEKAQKIVSFLNNTASNTIKIYVTATYNKPLHVYGVKESCKITWDMNDIKIMQNISEKDINDNAIRQQFGTQLYDKTLKYFGYGPKSNLIDNLKKEYGIFPKPYMITTIWDKDYLNVEKLKIGDTEFGWDMNKLFATVDSTFANEEQMKEMMRYYFGSPDKKEDYNRQPFYRTRGIMPRIRNICLNQCRTLQPQHKTSQLWFLPLGKGNIKDKTIALVTLLTESNEFKDIKNSYHFFVAVDVEDKAKKGRTINGVTYMGDQHNIKDEIEKIEKKIEKGELKQDNLIILSGKRLQLGISLRNVDIVTLWNSITSSDAIFQILFRSMTEVERPECTPSDYCNKKKFGFMVDMNPQRSMTTTTLFGENISKNLSKTNKEIFTQITDLINIDEDVFLDKYQDDTRDKFVNDLFNKFYQAWNISSDDIKRTVSKFTFDIAKLEKMKNSLLKINTNTGTTTYVSEPEESIAPAKKKTLSKAPKEKEPKDKEINLNEKAAEIMSEFITLLNIFTLYEDKGAKCILSDKTKVNSIEVKNDINELKDQVYSDDKIKDTFLKILNGRLLGDSSVLFPELIINEVLDAMNVPNDKLLINKIIMSQKKEYYTINEPEELLNFINEQLKPKEKERKENGEVFTPIMLVKEMLNKLDDSYIKEHGKSIFTEAGFKWFDPAVGIGNFPIIVYQRLMKGLVQIPEEERRKHILENMIYSSELTPKNVFIYKKIFCGEKYKLNIYEGDTLKMDIKKEFKLPSDFVVFDVVLGNPPFQEKVGPTNTKPIWNDFVIKSLTILKSGGYLVYVHPSGWRNVDGKFKNIQQEILKRDLQYLEIHNENDGLKTFSSETRYDWYVLKNTKVDSTQTIIRFQDGTTKTINVNGLKFIPNGEYDKIVSMITKKEEEKINTLHSESLYAHRQTWMSGTETKEYKYPCVYTVNSKGNPTFLYSSKQHGHFGVPKFIWSNGRISSIGSYIDINGDYGLSEYSYAIVDEPENLPKIKQVFDSKEFRNLMELCAVGKGSVNYKVISIFKKDFWKVFKYFDLNKEEVSKIENTQTNTLEIRNSKKNTLKLKNNIAKRKAENPNYRRNGKTPKERKQQNALKKKQASNKMKKSSQKALGTIVNVNSRTQKNTSL